MSLCVLDIDMTSLTIPCVLTPQEEYFLHHPTGVNPVLLNDVVFSVNAAIAQTITVIQCFILKVSPVFVDLNVAPLTWMNACRPVYIALTCICIYAGSYIIDM